MTRSEMPNTSYSNREKYFLITATILLACLTLWTCKKDNVDCSDNETFCALVDDQNFDATGLLIDDFLATLKKDNQDENLKKLKDWLECKSCVIKVEILCNSCIYTNPLDKPLQLVPPIPD